jgi:Fe-S-cluster containining protein
VPVISVDKLLRNVRQGYHAADVAFSAGLGKSKLKVSCTRGCGACCYQFVSVSFVEALLIGEFVVRLWSKEAVAKALEDLDAHAELQHNDRERYFLERRPCVFFVPGQEKWSGECGIYRVRPMACRFQYVTSPPALCAPERSYECEIVDSREVTLKTLERITGRDGGLASQGPLPLMVAEAIRCVLDDRQPSPFVLENGRRRIGAVLAHDRAKMDQLGIDDRYVTLPKR